MSQNIDPRQSSDHGRLAVDSHAAGSKSKWVALILNLLFGWLGAQHWYVGNVTKGCRGMFWAIVGLISFFCCSDPVIAKVCLIVFCVVGELISLPNALGLLLMSPEKFHAENG